MSFIFFRLAAATCGCRKSFFLSFFQIFVDLRQPQVDPNFVIFFTCGSRQSAKNAFCDGTELSQVGDFGRLAAAASRKNGKFISP